MKRHTLIIVALLAVVVLPLPIQAQDQDPKPDRYEPDEVTPPWIGLEEVQERSFYPEDDVDRARLRVKAGHWYEVHTRELAPLVDTVLTVQLGEIVYEDDDGGSEPLASRLTFQAQETADAILTIVNSQGVYSTTQTYKLYAGEAAPPTPTPSPTPTSTPTPMPTPTPPPTESPAPTHTPAPTTAPAKPIISFAAFPDRVEKPGECVTLRWHVERATEVYLVCPNGNREGVVGEDERQVCPLESGVYSLEVRAPGGDETVEVHVAVPTPTPTPTPVGGAAATGSTGSRSNTKAGKGTVHIVVFVDENRSEAYDLQEGVLGAAVTLMSQADPNQLWTATTDPLGQVHFPKVPAGGYTLLIPHLGHAETVSFRGEDLTVDVLIPPIQLPARIP